MSCQVPKNLAFHILNTSGILLNILLSRTRSTNTSDAKAGPRLWATRRTWSGSRPPSTRPLGWHARRSFRTWPHKTQPSEVNTIETTKDNLFNEIYTSSLLLLLETFYIKFLNIHCKYMEILYSTGIMLQIQFHSLTKMEFFYWNPMIGNHIQTFYNS